MAIDHVRVYSGLPAGGPTPGIFFTRWVTHFVAPAFCFLAGTAAFLYGSKVGDRGALRRYLVTRGAILVLLEMTVIRISWTFNLDYAHYLLAGVIWMLGVSMILLAGLVGLSIRTLTIVGAVIVFGQQLLGLLHGALPEGAQGAVGWLFQVLYFGGPISLGSQGPTLAILYSIVPWIGVMALGYAFGVVMTWPAEQRRRWCLRVGLGSTAAFLALAIVQVAVSSGGAESPPVLFRILGQQKYPASQLFLLMTVGPLIALVPWAERARGWVADALDLFGRVPMWYYLLHIPLIHVAAIIVSVVRTGSVVPWLFGNHPMMPPDQPAGYMWSLGLLYLVLALVMPVLYLACRWYAGVKATRPKAWMRFI
jgi:uncharacterized membrane protein